MVEWVTDLEMESMHSRLWNRLVQQGLTGIEQDHALRVMGFCEDLFDQLQGLHGMGSAERRWLTGAALAHDIAKSRFPREHHKLARDWMLQAKGIPLDGHERVIMALVARYHRSTDPKPGHRYYSDLGIADRVRVCKLTALLRLADGLDKNRGGRVRDLVCAHDPQAVQLDIHCRRGFDAEKLLRKAGLFEQVFDRRIKCQLRYGSKGKVLRLECPSTHAYAEAS